MRLSYDLTLEQSQKLIMTPELRQAIELLQFNSLELKDYLANELEENPMLELTDSHQEHESIEEHKEENEIDWKEYFEKYGDTSYRPQVDKNIKEHNYESYVSYEPSLREYLMSQLNLISLGDKEHKIGENIIQNIDDNGYLTIPLEDIVNFMECNIEEVETMLGIVQTLDPLGVGSRDLRECLLIQMKEREDLPPFAVEIVEGYLEDISQNRIQKIAKDLNLDCLEVQKTLDFIKTLEPKPGRCYSGNCDSVRYVSPDAEIRKIDGKFVVILNDVTGPRLNINNYYRNMLRTGKDEKALEFLNNRFNSAMWIIRSIEQRKSTIKKVIESILKFQMDFFLEGARSLKPLTLKDVAEDIEMHESTISRATNGKYVQTPRGLFELKYFFSSGLESIGGDISSTSIKLKLKEIIDNENTKKPLSDQKISDILEEKGISISRRTVAKYRDELNIPSSSMRRRF